jgi:CBS domain-containing protein
MKLKDIMSSPVEIVSPDTTLVDVARKMKDSGTGFSPVCDGERVHGVVTDRDLVVRGIAGGKPAATTKARDVMTSGVCY